MDGGAESAFIAVSAVCRDQEPLTLPSPHRYVFSVVELVALRRVAPRPAAQRLPQTERSVRAVPPLHAAELSQRDKRYRLNRYEVISDPFMPPSWPNRQSKEHELS